ncbi:hypothetical protein BsWGS_27496 [Bradybaena similaris]
MHVKTLYIKSHLKIIGHDTTLQPQSTRHLALSLNLDTNCTRSSNHVTISIREFSRDHHHVLRLSELYLQAPEIPVIPAITRHTHVHPRFPSTCQSPSLLQASPLYFDQTLSPLKPPLYPLLQRARYL